MSKALSSHALHSYLLKDGVTLNDVNDPDDGPNFLTNFTLLASVTATHSLVTIQGSLNSKPHDDYRIEFFANAGQQIEAQDPSTFRWEFQEAEGTTGRGQHVRHGRSRLAKQFAGPGCIAGPAAAGHGPLLPDVPAGLRNLADSRRDEPERFASVYIQGLVGLRRSAVLELSAKTGLEVTLEFLGLAPGFESDVQLQLPWTVPACRVSLAGVVAFETALQVGGVADVTRAGFGDTLEDVDVEHARPP